MHYNVCEVWCWSLESFFFLRADSHTDTQTKSPTKLITLPTHRLRHIAGVGEEVTKCKETRSIWKMLGPFATTSRLTPIHQVSPLYCRTPPAHRCSRRQRRQRRRQRQRVTEGTAMAPWNGHNYAHSACMPRIVVALYVSVKHQSGILTTDQGRSSCSCACVNCWAHSVGP